MTNHFDRAVSLGLNCQVRYHVSRVLWIRAGGDPSAYFPKALLRGRVYDWGSYFFDWSWRDPDPSRVLALLVARFARCYEREDLVVKPVGDGWQVLNQHTGLYYPHDYHLAGGNDTIPEEQFEKNRAKALHMARKLSEVLEGCARVLLVLAGPPHRFDDRGFLTAVRSCYCNPGIELLTVRFLDGPYASSDLMTMNDQRYGLYRRNVPWMDWPGSNDGWQAVFRDFRFAPADAGDRS